MKQIRRFTAQDMARSRIKEMLLSRGVHLGKSVDVNETRLVMDSIQRNRISNVVDIGANSGQFALRLLHSGYSGCLHFYEPDPGVFKELSKRSSSYDNWVAFNAAVTGPNDNGKNASLYVASNTGFSSSLRKPTPVLFQQYGKIQFQETIQVNLIDLSSALQNFETGSLGNVLVKADVQGSERDIFENVKLGEILCIQSVLVEISHMEIYGGEWMVHEAIEYFHKNHFRLVVVSTEDYDSKVGSVQSNFLFERVK